MKYNIKVFDNDRVLISAIVPIEDVYTFSEPYIDKYTIKVYMLTEDE